MTSEQVSALSDYDLNIRMIDLFIKDGLKIFKQCNCCDCSYECENPIYTLNYLTDWNLTMPLAFENSLLIGPMNNSLYPDYWTARNNKAIGVSSHNKNPLRAICEVLVLIKCQS